jgi:DnaA family protein
VTAVEQLVLELAPAPEPTLDNFHAGGNAAVLSALRAALAGGEPILYLWGPTGCGKSHLLRAMAREAGQSKSDSQESGQSEEMISRPTAEKRPPGTKTHCQVPGG